MTYTKTLLMHKSGDSYIVIKQHDNYIKMEMKERGEPWHHKVLMIQLSEYITVDGLTDFYTHNNYCLVSQLGK